MPMKKPLFLIFGRFQPPTIGHELMFKTALQTAQKVGGVVVVFVSHTEDNKNPLSYSDKVAAIKNSVPSVVIGPAYVRTPAEALTWAFDRGYQDITILVGEDREEGFEKLVGSWQKSEDPKQHAKVRVMSLPRQGSMDASKVSGTVARRYARLGDLKNFAKILISGAQDTSTARRFMNTIQGRLGKLTESHMKKSQKKTAMYEDIDPQVQRVVESMLLDSSYLNEDNWLPEPAAMTKKPDMPTTIPDNSGDLDPDERVPEDTPDNKSVLVLYPDRRLKYDTITKAKEQKTGEKDGKKVTLKLKRPERLRTK